MPPLFIIAVVLVVIIFTWIHFKNKRAAADNIIEGEAFLKANADNDDVHITKSGLQYTVLEPGNGDRNPSAKSEVTVHYHGTLLDGSVFDSSVERGQPISFPLNRVIPGWTEGVQLMVEGEKRRLFIPSYLAYGNRSAGIIKPGSTLIFDVELIAIKS
ncbi:FKBP-type peptidyl-prolyl cis-trans isomerase [Bermanella sp. R86510]|uniref:FKBP-type peptidyl-prolyl cis-trans isomerase n=1 Tax=unclassified Bermanella TaxID=2627862 RepID=UPI0037CC04D9